MSQLRNVRTISVFVLALALLAVPLAKEAGASPITLSFTGSVTSAFDPALVPLGSAATINLTVDPALNVWAGYLGCGAHPAGGAYAYSALMAFTGHTYTLSGYIEVNYDFRNCQPANMLLVITGLSGDWLVPSDPLSPRPLLFPCAGVCAYSFGGATVDPTSAAFPDFHTISLPLSFGCIAGSGCVDGRGTVVVSGTPDVAAVPEPATLLLLGTGLAAVAARRRFTKQA